MREGWHRFGCAGGVEGARNRRRRGARALAKEEDPEPEEASSFDGRPIRGRRPSPAVPLYVVQVRASLLCDGLAP